MAQTCTTDTADKALYLRKFSRSRIKVQGHKVSYTKRLPNAYLHNILCKKFMDLVEIYTIDTTYNTLQFMSFLGLGVKAHGH